MTKKKMPNNTERTPTSPMATSTTTNHEEEDDDALLLPPPTVTATVEPAKLKLLEARFGADPDNSNSQKSFDSPSLQYRLPHPSCGGTNVQPSWQRMQTPTTAAPPPPNKSSLKNKNARKQAHPQQRKSVVIVVQESPPTTKGSKGGNSNGSSSSNAPAVNNNRRKRKSSPTMATTTPAVHKAAAAVVVTSVKKQPPPKDPSPTTAAAVPEHKRSPPTRPVAAAAAVANGLVKTPAALKTTTHHTTATKILDFYSSNSHKKPRAVSAAATPTPSLTAIAMAKRTASASTATTAIATTTTTTSMIDWQAKYETTTLELADVKSQLRAIHNNRSILQLSLEASLKESRRELQTVRDHYGTRLVRYQDVLIQLYQDAARRQYQDLATIVAASTHNVEQRREQLDAERVLLQERQRQLLFLQQQPAPAPQFNHDVDRRLWQTEQVATRSLQSRRLDQDEQEWQKKHTAYQNDVTSWTRQRKLYLATQSSRFVVGQVLHQRRYVLDRLIGKGGFSEVWRAVDIQAAASLEETVVAVKIHQLDRRWSDAKKANYTKHVSREYDIHRAVNHDRIVALRDVFEIDADSFATVLEYCNGTDLDALLKECTRLTERDAKCILLQILTAMAYLSRSDEESGRPSIIHYDLKPANILLDETRTQVKITDFGLSKIMQTAASDNNNANGGLGGTAAADQYNDGLMELTSQGSGTYWYLPPECFLPGQQARINHKVDVWSIGVIYYQMVFGQRPFGHGQTQDAIVADGTILNARTVHFPDDDNDDNNNKSGGVTTNLLSADGRDFIRACLMYDQAMRPTVSELCEHPYVTNNNAAASFETETTTT